ncbi:MAG: C40 family peptidase [Lachnospiraceae bacterium]|nr:C40 family peptidase [Lachnospiraceae bacterium]
MAQEETVSEETTSVVELATVSAEETLEAEAEALKSMDITETALKSTDVSANEPEEEETEEADPEHFSNLVIANVNDYVNVRDLPSEEGNIVGKLYDDSVGTFISETDGWYLIQSGNTTGYVKGEFCVTGEDAIALAKEVGTRMATVTTTTLKVRQDPSTEAVVLGLVPIDEDLVVTEELDGWVKVNIEEGDGYVSTDYVNLWTDFVTAESKEEEEARLAKEKAEREAARKAAAAAQAAAQKKQQSSSGSTPAATQTVTSGGSEAGIAVANYALQFVGNPYVYGGTSLTNGADCSGFVMSVYANFGVSLPHSSKADRSVGSAVGSLAEAQPGDLICYSGHVALYIGNGQIVHASTSRTGIIVSSASYRTPLAIRRIF